MKPLSDDHTMDALRYALGGLGGKSLLRPAIQVAISPVQLDENNLVVENSPYTVGTLKGSITLSGGDLMQATLDSFLQEARRSPGREDRQSRRITLLAHNGL